MAKRFTDSAKWDHAWFRKLSPKMKCVWFYLVDKCDHAGVWVNDLESLSFHVGEQVTENEIKEFFSEKLIPFGTDKFIIPSFIDFQYGGLNPENRVHQSVLLRLEKLGANKVLKSPLKGAKDKDKDKYKDKDKVLGGVGEIELLKVYSLYPLKKGKAKGLAVARKELRAASDKDSYLADLKKAIITYAEDFKKSGQDTKYIKLFSTFMHEWRDWLDEDAGTTTIQTSKPKSNLDAWFEKKLAEEAV